MEGKVAGNGHRAPHPNSKPEIERRKTVGAALTPYEKYVADLIAKQDDLYSTSAAIAQAVALEGERRGITKEQFWESLKQPDC